MSTLGADPEVFITGPRGKVVSAHTLGIPPGKGVQDEKGAGSFGRDGWSLELRPEASTCRATLWTLTGGLIAEARKTFLPPGFGVSLKPIADVGEDLGGWGEWPPDLRQFGCQPAFDAWEGGEPIRNNIDAATHPFRYAGGHMHFGIGSSLYPLSGFRGVVEEVKKGEDEAARALLAPVVRKFDLTVGLVFTALFPGLDEHRRRRFYGKAGEFRLQTYKTVCSYCYLDEEGCKNYQLRFTGASHNYREMTYYGVEYRTPSSRLPKRLEAWSLLFGLGRDVINNASRLPEPPGEVRDVIQEASREGALGLLAWLAGVVEKSRGGGFRRWLNLSALAALIEEVDEAPDTPDQRGLNPEVFGWDSFCAGGVGGYQKSLRKAA